MFHSIAYNPILSRQHFLNCGSFSDDSNLYKVDKTNQKLTQKITKASTKLWNRIKIQLKKLQTNRASNIWFSVIIKAIEDGFHKHKSTEQEAEPGKGRKKHSGW